MTTATATAISAIIGASAGGIALVLHAITYLITKGKNNGTGNSGA